MSVAIYDCSGSGGRLRSQPEEVEVQNGLSVISQRVSNIGDGFAKFRKIFTLNNIEFDCLQSIEAA